MFDPSRDQVREMFFGAWRKYRAGEPIVGIESLALDVILQHPEYHGVLSLPGKFREKDYTDESNPFLHMSLHVALEEQLSIDQPPGIRDAVQQLARRHDSMHDARHDVMDCLAEVIWNAQRHGAAFDNDAYMDCIRGRKASSP